MLWQWLYDSFVSGDVTNTNIYEKIKQFLDENATATFSSDDVRFFMREIGRNLKLRYHCINSFLSNDERIFSIIKFCKNNEAYTLTLLESIDGAIYNEEKNHREITLHTTLFKNFPIGLAEKIVYHPSLCGSLFYLLCHIHQNKEFEYYLRHTCNFPRGIGKFIDCVKKILPEEKYKDYLRSLMMCSAIKKFFIRIRKLFLKKMKSIIRRKDVFLNLRIIQRIILSLKNTTSIKIKVFNIKENYTHFILKKILLPLVREKMK